MSSWQYFLGNAAGMGTRSSLSRWGLFVLDFLMTQRRGRDLVPVDFCMEIGVKRLRVHLSERKWMLLPLYGKERKEPASSDRTVMTRFDGGRMCCTNLQSMLIVVIISDERSIDLEIQVQRARI